MTTEPQTLEFNVTALPTLSPGRHAVLISTPLPMESWQRVPTAHGVLVECVDQGFLARSNVDAGAVCPSIGRALASYSEKAWATNASGVGHEAWVIETYLPKFDRRLSDILQVVHDTFPESPTSLVQPLNDRLGQLRADGVRTKLVTLPHSEVCMHMRVAGFVMWTYETPSGSIQILGFDGRKYGAPITKGEAGWPQPSETPGLKEAIDNYAIYLCEIVGKDTDEVNDRRQVAVWLAADIEHAYHSALSGAAIVAQDES